MTIEYDGVTTKDGLGAHVIDGLSDDEALYRLEQGQKAHKMELEACAAEKEVEALEGKLRDARKRVGELVAKVRQINRSINEPLPPIYAASLAKPEATVTPEPQKAEPSDPAELLSSVFAGLGKAVNKCHDAELYTIGQLQAFLDSGKTLRDIDGIGAMTAKEMERKIAEYKGRFGRASDV